MDFRLVLYWVFMQSFHWDGAAICCGSHQHPAGWDKLVGRRKEEKELTIYGNVGYESIFAEFAKKYPDIKLSYVTGRGSADIVPRVLSEQRAGKYLGDIFLAGPNGTFIIHQAKGLDALKPALMLPEVVDESKWWQGKHQYVDRGRRLRLYVQRYFSCRRGL